MKKIDDKFKEEMVKASDDENLEAGKKHGVTRDSLFSELGAELKAEKTEFFQNKGKIVEERDVIDWKTRQGAVDKGFKVLDLYPAEKHEHTGDVIFHSNVPEPDMPKEKEKFKDHPEQVEPGIGEHEAETEIPGEFIEEELGEPGHDFRDPPFKDHHRSRREDGKCRKTIYTPRYWVGLQKDGTYQDRPKYKTCSCGR